MYYLIQDDEITGSIENPEAFEGWTIAEYTGDREIADLYWDGTVIQEKPPLPGVNYFWAGSQWVEVPIAPPFSAPLPDWGSFRLAMMADPDYNAMLEALEAKQGGSRTVTRLENVINMAAPHVETIIFLWNAIFDRLESAEIPHPDALDRWEAAAQSARMPFTFDPESGVMSPRP